MPAPCRVGAATGLVASVLEEVLGELAGDVVKPLPIGGEGFEDDGRALLADAHLVARQTKLLGQAHRLGTPGPEQLRCLRHLS